MIVNRERGSESKNVFLVRLELGRGVTDEIFFWSGAIIHSCEEQQQESLLVMVFVYDHQRLLPIRTPGRKR